MALFLALLCVSMVAQSSLHEISGNQEHSFASGDVASMVAIYLALAKYVNVWVTVVYFIIGYLQQVPLIKCVVGIWYICWCSHLHLFLIASCLICLSL